MNHFFRILIHLILVTIWTGFSVMAFWDRLKFGWQLTTGLVLTFSLVAAVVLAIDLDITIVSLNLVTQSVTVFPLSKKVRVRRILNKSSKNCQQKLPSVNRCGDFSPFWRFSECSGEWRLKNFIIYCGD